MRRWQFLFFVALLIFSAQSISAAIPCVPPEYLLDLPRDKRYRDGAFSISIKGGIVPTWFLTRSKNNFFEQLTPTNEAPFEKRLDKFHRSWDMPWLAGGEIAYVTCGRIEFFGEGEYCRALSKRYDKSVSGLGEYKVKYSNYLHVAGYGGVRLYSASFWCCKFTAFMGGKVGVLYRRHATGQWCFTPDNLTPVNSIHTLSYKQGYVPSGGLQVGINYEATKCFAIVLKTEALVSGCWETDSVPFTSPAPYIVLGTTGPVLSFPITLAVRCNF